MPMHRRIRTSIAAATLAAAITATPSVSARHSVSLGHGLTIDVPAGWHVTHRHFTPCIDPVERFSLVSGDQQLMLQERIHPVRQELSPRPAHFGVRGKPTSLECCSVGSRAGWTLQFGDHGRAFYAYLYPGHHTARQLLSILDTLRVQRRGA
jgi:hypothetical protein